MELLNYSCQDAVPGLHVNVTAGLFVLLGKCLFLLQSYANSLMDQAEF